MKNKVLVKLIVPELDATFDVFIPVNELVWKIKKLILKSVSDLNNINTFNDLDCVLINKDNSKIYNNNEIILETDIRNSSELILISR
mgnify:FL=1